MKKNITRNLISLVGLIFFIFLIIGSDDPYDLDCGDGNIVSSNDAIDCYLDQDGDGFGKGYASLECYSCPDGYSNYNTDCYDQNSNVFPGSSIWSSSDRGDGSFDYNCDNQEVEKWGGPSNLFLCTDVPGGQCLGRDGWDNGLIPWCGESWTWVAGCSNEGNQDCNLETSFERYQECR